MFRKNERLRAAEEVWDYTPEEVQEYIRCATDFVYWAERYAKISTLDHGIQLVKLRDYQRRMVNEIVKLEAEGKRGMVVLAPRQCGKTTGIHLYLTWQANFFDTQSIAIIANKSKNAMKILRSIKQTIEYMPLWMQAGCVNGGWNKLSIELGNGSQVITGTAQNEAIRGGTFHAIYLDEYAFIPKHAADDFMKSVLPSIMAGKNTRIFATSTPKGMNQFWTMWRKAESGKSMFKAFRIRYEEVPGYGDPNFKRQIVDTEGIMTWKQEFECAFLGSSKTLIQPEYIEASKPVDPIRIEFNDWLHIWENPIKGAMYILGVDVAKGVGGDYSVIQVVKIEGLRKLTQVARFSCNTMNLDDFAQVCISISKFYNQSELIVENNDLGGVLTGKIADVYQYDHLVSYEKGFWGVRAGRKSKAIGNSYLRDYVENGWIKVNDVKAWSEFATYEELRDNIFAAIPGNHDDQVMSLMWAVYYVISSADLDDEVETQINPRFRIGNGQYEEREADDNFHGDWMGGGNYAADDTAINRATNYHAASPDIQALFGGRVGGGEADMFSMIGDDFGNEYDLR